MAESNENDRLVFELLMKEPDAVSELARAEQLLDESIARGKFNRERAREIFLFVVDNCAHRYFRGYPGGARVLFPRTIREPFADELTREFVLSRDNVESQRPARTGLMRHILGK